MRKAQKRTYDSTARKEKAMQSRENLLESARQLFMDDGYEATTIGQIAHSSGVSDQTVYALFKSKLGVLRAVMDECFPESERKLLVEQAAKEKNPKKRLAVAAKIARQLYDSELNQAALLQDACALLPELKQLEQERETRRYKRLSSTINTMFTEKVIDPSLTRKKALDVFWAFTGRDMYRLFVVERGWSSKQYEEWLAQTLSKVLLKK